MFKFLLAFITAFTLMSCTAETPQDLSGMTTQRLTFEVDGTKLSGILNTQKNGNAEALVIFVHGYGETNVVEQNWYYDLRSKFAAQNVSSFVWDKPGCGESEGEFDVNQAVESSAEEVVAAAAFLRSRNIQGG